MQDKIIKCPMCGGTGNGPLISHDVAEEIGLPEVEGEYSMCVECGGTGVDVSEEEEQRARDEWEDMKVEEYLLRKKGIEP